MACASPPKDSATSARTCNNAWRFCGKATPPSPTYPTGSKNSNSSKKKAKAGTTTSAATSPSSGRSPWTSWNKNSTASANPGPSALTKTAWPCCAKTRSTSPQKWNANSRPPSAKHSPTSPPSWKTGSSNPGSLTPTSSGNKSETKSAPPSLEKNYKPTLCRQNAKGFSTP